MRALALEQTFDLILGREDVKNVKPDPEIYLLAARRLGVEPRDCVVIEDSPSGVRAGIAAGMNVVAFATPFSTAGIHSSDLLDHAWVVHDPEDLVEVVTRRIAEHA